MTADDPALTPAEDAAVRARLAEARHTDPVPDRRRRPPRRGARRPRRRASRRRRRSRRTGRARRTPRLRGAGASSPPAWSPPRPSWPLGVGLPQVLDSTGGSDSASSRLGGGQRRLGRRGRARPGRRRGRLATVPRPRPRPASWRSGPGRRQRAVRLRVRRPPRAEQRRGPAPAVRPLRAPGSRDGVRRQPRLRPRRRRRRPRATPPGTGSRRWSCAPRPEGRQPSRSTSAGRTRSWRSTTLRAP